MIYTCTLNPSLDYFIQVDHFQPGTLNRMSDDKKMPGGKGINVSRVLKRLETDSVATGFLGGFTGAFIQSALEEEKIKSEFIRINGDTRINVKLKSNQETEINGLSPEISSAQIRELQDRLAQLKEGDALVLSGSLPDSLPKTFYHDLTHQLHSNGVKIIVDTSGEALKMAVKAKPFLIKPNHEELSQLFGVPVDSERTAIPLAVKLHEDGISNVIVSMGGDGALLVSDEGIFHAKAPQGNVKNSVGAGDSLIGGFIAKYSETNDVIQAFQYGAAAGSATAFSVDLCTKDYVEHLLPEVEISKREKEGDYS